MIFKFKPIFCIVIFFSIFLSSCSKIRESAGVTRKSLDEFQVVENPPLVIPPDFNLISPDKLEQNNIADVEKELAKEILFGLNEEEQNISTDNSTINEILSQSEAMNISDNIRDEIDQEFSQEKKTNNAIVSNWENEEDVLDAVKESERIRNRNFEGKSISEGELPTKKEKIKIQKKKKKKRFWFF